MDEHRNKVEVILFTTGRFMDVEEIGKLVGIGSLGVVKDKLRELKEEYENKRSSLEIIEENGKWKLNIKKQYNYLTTNLLQDTELDNSTTKTLAIIAYKQPVLQSEIIKHRGNGAYDHIRILKERELVSSERKGRTRLLKLTPKFYDYFDIVENELKSKFENVEDVVIENENTK